MLTGAHAEHMTGQTSFLLVIPMKAVGPEGSARIEVATLKNSKLPGPADRVGDEASPSSPSVIPPIPK